MAKRCFSPVKNNIEKQKTYREVMVQYKRAIDGHFYGEAMMINYAVIEDRLRAFLFHIGALKSIESYQVDNQNFLEFFELPTKTNKHGKMFAEIDSISKKITIIKRVLRYISDNLENSFCMMIWQTLGSEFENLRFLEELKKIQKWKDPRNEIVHALLNKNTDEVNRAYDSLCSDGENIGEYLNTQVKKLKKNPEIRKMMCC